MTAASEIIKEEGAIKFTLEAVAQRARISKGGLLYHFPSKEALVRGMVEEWENNYFNSFETLVNKDNKEIGKWNRAYIHSTISNLENKNKKISSALMAAMFINPKLLEEFQYKYNNLVEKLMNDGIEPVKVSIARLALDGLWFSEIFGFSPLDKQTQKKVFDELFKMIREE